MNEPDPRSLLDTEAARSPSALLALGLHGEMPDADTLAAALPQYEDFALIGHGGMGVVWRARQIQLDRVVAIKLLRPELAADPCFAERFAREARALARLQHAGIVAVYDFGEVLGLYYLVMEHIEGTDLRAVLEQGVTAPQALAIVPQLCDALQYAHDEGVVHRDVKPENILIDRRGRVKIVDFGLAKLRGGVDDRATSGRVLGTPHYMAPEQIDRPADVDHRADIFALGVVIYEMLTGKLPLGVFAAPSRVRPCDVRLDEVVLRTLEHDRERRFQHASEVKDRVVALGPDPNRVRLGADEVERRVTAERDAAVRHGAYAVILFFAFVLAEGLWFDLDGERFAFGFSGGRRLGEGVKAWSLPILLALGYIPVAISAWRDRGSRRGAVMRAKLGVGLAFAFVVATVWSAANAISAGSIHGNPFVNGLAWLGCAGFSAYNVWSYAIEQRLPARIVLGPSWWIPRWEAEL